MKFGKHEGWKKVKKLNLPTSDLLAIVSHENISSIKSLLISFSDEDYFLCRPDAPIGDGMFLPRGRTLKKGEILPFFISFHNKKEILLVFEYPFLDSKKKPVNRYQLDNGIFIYFENHKTAIEIVGKGFDVGDITRGQASHQRIIIPYWAIHEQSAEIHFKLLFDSEIFNSYSIPEDDYMLQRKKRIQILQESLEPKRGKEINFFIPEHYERIKFTFFKKLLKKIIQPVLKERLQEENFGLLINSHQGNIYVFEIWNSLRSKPKT